jgi:hypothetical protein
MNELVGKKITQDSCCSSLSWSERLIGFLICFSIGALFLIISFFRITDPIKGDAEKFAIIFSLGNILILSSICFIVGFNKQRKIMFKKTRLITSLIFIISMISVLLLIFLPMSQTTKEKKIYKYGLMILVIIEYISMIWYNLSYIPFGRRICKFCCKRCCKKGGESLKNAFNDMV